MECAVFKESEFWWSISLAIIWNLPLQEGTIVTLTGNCSSAERVGTPVEDKKLKMLRNRMIINFILHNDYKFQNFHYRGWELKPQLQELFKIIYACSKFVSKNTIKMFEVKIQ